MCVHINFLHLVPAIFCRIFDRSCAVRPDRKRSKIGWKLRFYIAQMKVLFIEFFAAIFAKPDEAVLLTGIAPVLDDKAKLSRPDVWVNVVTPPGKQKRFHLRPVALRRACLRGRP
jgi:hypothetical protein